MSSPKFEIPQNIPIKVALGQLEETQALQQRVNVLLRIIDQEKHNAFEQLCRFMRGLEASNYTEYSAYIEELLKKVTDAKVKGAK